MTPIKDEYKNLKFFTAFDKNTAELLMEIGDLKKYQIKDIVFDEQQDLKNLLVLLNGSVTIGILISGKGRINIGTIHPGEIFSWSALFPPQISTAYAIANEPLEVLSISASRLNALIEKDHSFGYYLMKHIATTLSQRLRDTRFQLVNIVTI